MTFRSKNDSKKDSFNFFKNEDDLNIPSYNDERINREIANRERKEAFEKKQKEKEEENRLRNEEIKKLTPIMDIPEYLLIACAFLIILIALSVFTFSFMYAIYGIVSIGITLYIGRRLKINFDDELNIILWNISESFKDFFEYKFKYDILSGSRERLKKVSNIFTLILVLFNSNSIVFAVSLILIIVCYMASFSNKEMDSIETNSKNIVLGALAGLLLKTILNTLFVGTLTIDFMNIIILNLFVSIHQISAVTKIYKPN